MGTRGRRVVVTVAAVCGVLGVALVALSLALNAYVHRHQQEILSQLEQRLGRKVEVRRLSASLFTGLSADGVVIGPSSAPGDQPLLTIDRVRVRPSILRTLLSFGRRPQVADVRLIRPTVNVVRFADGTLNLDRIAARPAQAGPPMPERTRRMIENARLAEARITDGRIHVVDLAAGGRPVDVTALDLTVRDLGIRRHPSIDLRAAIQAAQPNFELRAQLGEAGSLEHVPPPVESAHLKLARTDLAPLAPLLSRFVPELEGGVASIDLDLQARGNAGLRGNAQLTGARFAHGAPFDARLDADVAADARKGDLDVRRFDLVVADMSVTAHGRLTSLERRPRFEGFAVASRNLDFDRVRRLYPSLDRALGAELHGPAELGATAAQDRFTAFLDLTAASVAAPGRFDKPRGTPWRIDASGRALEHAVQIDALTVRLAQQTLRAHGTAHVGEPHPALDLYATSDGLAIAALSPLIPSLANEKLPPISISLNAHLTGRAGMPETMALDVDRLALASRKTDLAGSVRLRNFARPQLDVNARSSYLDTQDLLPAPRKQAAHGTSPSPLARVSGHVVIEIARGSLSGVPVDALRADLALRDGAVHANQLTVGAWGGRVTGDGSDLDAARGPFHLVGHVDHVDVEQMLARLGSARKVMAGRLSAQLDVRGRGTTGAELEQSLTGTLDGTVDGAKLLAFDLDDLLTGQLLRALPFRLPTRRLSNATQLGTLRTQIRFAGGAMTIERPLTASTPEGPLQLTGRVSFDGRLDLTGTLALQPSAASALFANRMRLDAPLPLSLRLAGDLHRPSLTIVNLGEVANVLVRSAAGAFIPGRQEARIPSQKQLEDEALKGLKGLLHR